MHLPEGCEGYSSKDGVLYREEGRCLVFFPPWYPAKGGSFVIPEGVEKIEERAFYYSRLQRVEMPDSVTKLGKDAFLKSRLLEEAYLSDEIEELPSSGLHARYVYTAGVFGGCEKLRFVHLPRKLKILGANAFFQTGLSQVQIPEGVEEIGVRAFYQTKITHITLPSSLRRVGKEAFFGETSVIEAREGTAQGLFFSAASSKSQKVKIRVRFSDQGQGMECLPLPINYRGTLSELLSQAWDGEEINWDAYARCIPSVKEEDLRMEMSFLAALHLSKKEGSPYRKYLAGRAGKLGEMLIREEEEEIFPRYLELLKPSRKICQELLSLCNEEGKAAFIPYLLSQSKAKEGGSDFSL
ncbi:MAG: leucine-rich repeat domain-containing protein [Blautia sp.]|nr:leucine-rich repeat domain-containing protein [Blautia sp.]